MKAAEDVERPRRSRRFAVTVTLIAVAAVASVVFAATRRDGSSSAATAAPAVLTSSSSHDEVSQLCASNPHAGHHMANWDSTMADDMLTRGCAWPYAPFLVSLDGGVEDHSIPAEFVSVPYATLWSLIGKSGAGVCTVAPIADPPGAGGFVFGFAYDIAPPACPTGKTLTLNAREYATRAFRDSALHSAAGAAVFGMGRWILQVNGVDRTLLAQLTSSMVAAGAAVLEPAP